jgi:filamentous hemagglutinin family protein
MIDRTAFLGLSGRRSLLLITASIAGIASGLTATPVQAQSTLASILSAQANAPKPAAQGPGTAPQRSVTMNSALSRQRATVSRAEQIRAYVLSARDAVIAANRGTVTDGLSTNGLDPTDTIREAVAAAQAGNTDRANELLVSASASLDTTGLKTWVGAGLPTQTTTADGKIKVTIDQTQERALLSWNSFNIGNNTTLQFNQKENGVAQPGWVAVNRVTNAVAPSQILGNLQADGTVVVLNQNGIIFGQNAQVNTHSLLASTLDLGNAASFVTGNSGTTQATTIKDRNDAYLENGLFTAANGTTGTNNDGVVSPLLVSGLTSGDGKQFSATLEGSIIVDAGAQITGGSGGFLILAAPEVNNAGTLTATDGQLSLQAGRAVSYDESTGADSDADPYVRGYKLNSYDFSGKADGAIVNSGLIQSTRGYISLGTGENGTIIHSGLLAATTSVSRNGKISLTAGTITLTGDADAGKASAIEILADDNGETIPVGSASEPASFKASQIEIGTQVLYNYQPFGALVATDLTMGQNALIYAPGADVSIGVNTLTDTSTAHVWDTTHPGHIDIATGAMIDVSGLKDVQLDASRNQIAITPVKQNELQDTPNYRAVALDGNFTLNGATLYIDPRITGVRDDGVAWVGSPLLEAGSIASQIQATAAQFLTKGGTVKLATAELTSVNNLTLSNAPSIHIASGATIDFSGGWVTYAAGTIKTSKLVTDDGRIVDISQADPNDVYVGVVEGFSSVQPRFGVLSTYLSGTSLASRYDQAYDEGRDAGSLTISGAAVSIDGAFYGNAFAGARQVNLGKTGTAIAADGRALQSSPYQLPSGGAVSITSLGDVIVYHGVRGTSASDASELLLSDTMLSGAGLSALSLTAAGAVTFADAETTTLQSADALTLTGVSDLELAPDGILSITAGRTIRFDGTIEAPSGSITALTMEDVTGVKTNGSVFRTGAYGDGNGDDILGVYAVDPGELNPFDIVVAGTLSTAGLWVNDYTETGIKRGGAYSDGGSISLTVAPNIFRAVGSSLTTAKSAVDLSGSILVSGTLNVASGGYVTPTGSLVLDGKGGNVSLINETVYASTRLTQDGQLKGDGSGRSNVPIDGTSQSVEFTPIAQSGVVQAVLPALVPTPSSTVDISSATIVGYGFAGGGTFTLSAPDISFGSDNHAGSTHIGFDFFKTTGFGTLSASTYRSLLVDDVFDNGTAQQSAFLETTRFVVGKGETLDLTQWMLPTILTSDQSKSLRGLGTGADLATQAFLTPTTNDALYDRKAANLVLGGLTELDVLDGGQIIGAPGASLTVSKLYNAGSIVLHGGTISQVNDLIDNLVIGGLGVRSTDLGGNGLADAFGGGTNAQGLFDENAPNAAGITDPSNPSHVLTNAELMTREGADRLVYFLGMLDQGQGVVLTSGSVTDLSGIAVLNPRAAYKTNGTQLRSGYVLAGGTLELASPTYVSRLVTSNNLYQKFYIGGMLVRDDGATLDVSGASMTTDLATGMGNYTPYVEWSAAGTISALSGGTLGTTAINARGGVTSAQGGTLEWLAPTIGSGDGAEDYLSAALIQSSGFDTVIARGSLTLDGDFTLTLRKALMVTSQDPLVPNVGAANDFSQDASVSIGATAGTEATIAAGYVRFASRIGTTSINQLVNGDATVSFVAGAQGIDVVGGIGFDDSIASVSLATPADVRLTGVNERSAGYLPVYNGLLIAAGDLTIDAGRTYATTGTGNLQRLLENVTDVATPVAAPFDIVALGDHTIRFGNSYLNPDATAPLSAGTYLRVLAARIEQDGYLAAPLGRLELGSNTIISSGGYKTTPTTSITFGSGSVTSVSGAGLDIPYGTTTDGIEYYFPTVGTPLTQMPSGELHLSAINIIQEEGATFDGSGGGDVDAYEFQSGKGGSRDVLSRTSDNGYTSNNYDAATRLGYQYPDERQVYALVPVSQAGSLAAYDPNYSAGYANLYGAQAGMTITLDAAPGVTAGEYLLVPAKYAMSVPGALRVVQNTSAIAPVPGQSTKLLDGSVIVGGTYGYVGTGIAESTRYSFTVQTKDVFTKYSSILTTSGSDYLTELADKNGTGRPRLPLDAARVVLAPLNELKVLGLFDTSAVDGGQGGEFDILGAKIVIAGDESENTSGALLIGADTLAKLNATSLLIGGQRTENADGTTSIAATASSITVTGSANLAAPELLLAVGGTGSSLTIADGAQLAATGAVGTQSSADYITTGAGSLLRLANGDERLVTRTGTGVSTINIGAATISGDALALDSSGSFIASDNANIGAKTVAISGQAIQFDGSTGTSGQAGVIGASLEAKLAAAERLTARSSGAILFSAGTHDFKDLVLDAASLAMTPASAGGALTINAANVSLRNAQATADGCATLGTCGSGDALTLNAATIAFGANDVHAASFTGGVTLAASDGMYVEGAGRFLAGDAALTLRTPSLAERSAVADPRNQGVQPDYAFLTTGDVTISAAGTNSAASIGGNAAPGTRIAFGTSDAHVRSLSIDGTRIRATAGIIDIQADTNISLTGASLETPGYQVTFGDEVDPVVVSAGGGTINLFAANGNITTDAASTLISDTGIGIAGTINLLASNGAITLDATLNPGATGTRQGSLTFDSGTGDFDLSGFADHYGALFGGDLWVRSGAGDLDLASGRTIKAKSVTLTADGGAITVAGTIDTSGVDVSGMSSDAAINARVNGGDIQLWGKAGVTLTSTALLDAHTTGYADSDTRPASAGNVTIGIDRSNAAITIANGAVIDVGARRTQADPGVGRLVPQTITDVSTGTPTTVYYYVVPDTGGTVTFRAPVIGANYDKVALSQKGSIQGANSIQLEAFQRYDLDTLADSGLYTGITRATDGTVLLDFGATGANPLTTSMTLGDGTASLVKFIQNFAVSTLDGSSLDGMRLRPGVELDAKAGIETKTAWNLAAATFSTQQIQAAVDAGVLEVIPEISTAGEPHYKVVPGREGDLLEYYATFLYRTDGGSALGEAPVVTLRAGGDLSIDRSISDGFFTFRDKSDPAYLNWQLGGGDRSYQPAISINCGSTSGSCANIASYGTGANPGTAATLTILLSSQANKGDLANGASDTINSPLAITGNGANGGGEGQDSLGFGELFPLLDGNVAMHSSDIRLVAGAGTTLSANPLVVNRALAADVTVGGEYSYAYSATGTVSFAGDLQFRLLRQGGTDTVTFDIGDTLDLTETLGDLDKLKDDAYTQLNWGSTAGLGADARAAAQAYFAGRGYSYVGSATAPTGIIAPLNEVIAFLQSFQATYQAGLASGRTGYTANKTSTVMSYGTANKAYVDASVRSGDGSISVSAARDIDLRGSDTAIYRKADGTQVSAASYTGSFVTAAQAASSAIYTAGVRVAQTQVTARIVGTGELVSITPDSPYFAATPEDTSFIPSPMELSDTEPALAHGGGDISLEAGRDILARRDAWSEVLGTSGQSMTSGDTSSTASGAGAGWQLWRTGVIGDDTELGISPRYFTSGVGALAGGDVTIHAGRNVSDLTVSLLSGVTSTLTDAGAVMLTLGSGNLALNAGNDILAGRFDIATGRADVHAGGDIAVLGTEPIATATPQYLRVQLSNAVFDLSAGGSATIASVSALGAGSSASSAGFFSPLAAFSLSANGEVQIAETASISKTKTGYGQQGDKLATNQLDYLTFIQVLPPTLKLASLTDSVVLPKTSRNLLYPSAMGQLEIYSAGDISMLNLAMSDADPGLLAGAFASNANSIVYSTPYVTANTTTAQLRAQHSSWLLHADDADPIRIYTLGSIDTAALFLPKQSRVSAGDDIIDLFFQGQNVSATDITRVWAGGDIKGTTASIGTFPYVKSNDFILGGPGAFIVEAGGDIGPFVTSANVVGLDHVTYSNAGGIRTIGNDYNPWLPNEGADLSVRFGMAGGADYAALRETYLNPDNAAMLDGDLFAQATDSFGNASPDRSKPVYAPILAAWLRDHYPALFVQVFGGQSFASDTALANAAYGRMAALYAAFVTLDTLHQQDFLINKLYFHEIAETADVSGPSYQQYIRGYRAIQTLFPTSRGYTDNLAMYSTDPATISVDHPLGEPTRNIVNGEPQKAVRVLTGNMDLRLATIQTSFGGNVSILGPGGDVIAGSVVRTSDQSSRRATAFRQLRPDTPPTLEAGFLNDYYAGGIASIPLGYEGVLTLRGGEIMSFTDGDFILNQSRVFSQQTGDITMWSSNGDLNAGQGPKSASTFPPITIRLDENGFAEVNSAGSVSGAGIGSFQRTVDDPPSDVILIAPVGTVDAGDAGVRASGNIVVAAARVANADNFKAAGDITGVPTGAVTASVATPASAAAAVAAQAAGAAKAANDQNNRRSLITVDVLGPASERKCDPNDSGDCR